MTPPLPVTDPTVEKPPLQEALDWIVYVNHPGQEAVVDLLCIHYDLRQDAPIPSINFGQDPI